WRKPGETLAFFGVEPDMKVGEYAPGGEWYSRMLGLYLGAKGQLVGLYFNPVAGPFNEKTQQGIRDGAAKYPADIAGWSGIPAERFSAMTLENLPDDQKGTFDRILVMRMMHNLMRWNIADSEIEAMRDLLKPGGMIGIEQHRAKPDAPYSYADGSKGYLREADVIKFMEVHGFDLVGSADFNANPKDPANHAEGVWEVKPSWRTKKPELENIGESDRMTLLFRKRP
ncbi:MAG: class I SAM-dependent methyltransferase, partial [Tsuneonella sp.]